MSVYTHVPSRLQSHETIRSGMTSINVINKWKGDSSSTTVVHQTLVSEPTIPTTRFWPSLPVVIHAEPIPNRTKPVCNSVDHTFHRDDFGSCDCWHLRYLHLGDTWLRREWHNLHVIHHSKNNDVGTWLKCVFVSCCICVVLLWALWGGPDGIDT